MDKNEKEKKLLLQMSASHKANDSCFTMPDKNAESYFTERNVQSGLMEYGFQTVPELMQLLQQESTFAENEKFLQILAIAAFKNRCPADKNTNQKVISNFDKGKEILPAHIYNM